MLWLLPKRFLLHIGNRVHIEDQKQFTVCVLIFFRVTCLKVNPSIIELVPHRLPAKSEGQWEFFLKRFNLVNHFTAAQVISSFSNPPVHPLAVRFEKM